MGMSRIPFLIVFFILLSGCTSMVSERFAANLGDAILSQDDPEIAAASIPTFLLMMDSLVLDSPENPTLLSTSADLYGAYASLFVSDKERAGRMMDKSFHQARKAICEEMNFICEADQGPLDQFQQALDEVDEDELPLLYSYGTAWAGWIQTHKDDWNALAQVAKVEAVMDRVVALNENYEWGRAHLYLGVMNSQLPPALGGKPEKGRMHFEKAIEISHGNDLIAKVEFARYYARLVFDQELHDRLLHEVLDAHPGVARLNLSNALARQQAEELLATSREYFEE
jgi:hypothetical protein